MSDEFHVNDVSSMESTQIYLGSDGTRVMELMTPKLTKQLGQAWLDDFEVNTTRVDREPHQFPSKEAAVLAAAVELVQNATDHTEEIITHPETNMVVDKDSLKWTLDGYTGFGVLNFPDGVDLQQIGFPLSLDCIGTGTVSKGVVVPGAGGFGDGSKTSGHVFTFYRFVLQFLFFCYCKDHSVVLVWNWVVKVFPGFTEPHLGIEIRKVPHTFEEYKHLSQPTMVTRLRCTTQNPEDLALLRTSCVKALSRFKMMYNDVADPKGLTISSTEGYGSWQRTKTFAPKVESFLDVPISLPKNRNSCLVLVYGIFYLFRASNMPTSLVIVIHGKGIPGSPFQVFTNQMREISASHLARVFVRQFAKFSADEFNRDALVAAFKPLLKGGSSFLIDNHAHALVRDLMYDMQSCQVLRNLLLFWRLSPPVWSSNMKEAAAQKRDVNKRVATAVIADEVTSGRVRYCQWLRGNTDNVVVVGPHADYQLFRPVPIDEETDDAANAVKRNKTISCPLEKDLLPAVKYIGGSSDISVIRIHTEAPVDIEPFNFRTSDKGTIVIYQLNDNPEKIVEAFSPHMIANSDESNRATQFFIHFVSNDARCMALCRRVKYAVRCSLTKAPYDVGPTAPKRKPEDQSSEEEDEETSDDEDPFEVLKKKLKMKKVAKKPSVSNVPRVKVPNLKSIPARMVGVNPSSSRGPAPEDPPEDSCPLEWNEVTCIYVATGSAFDLPSNIASTIATFHRVVDFLNEKINLYGVQVYPCYSPEDTWRGLYNTATKTAFINLYYVQTSSDILVVTIHELAHYDSGFHDINHGRGMMDRFQEIAASFLPF